MTCSLVKSYGYTNSHHARKHTILVDEETFCSLFIQEQKPFDHSVNIHNAQPEITSAVKNDPDGALQLETPPVMEHVYHSLGSHSPLPDDNDRPLEGRKVLELEREPGCFSACLDLLKSIFCCKDNHEIKDISKIAEITQNTYDKALEKGKDRAKAFERADEKAYKIIHNSMTLVAYRIYNELLFIQNHSRTDALRKYSISERSAKESVHHGMRDSLEENDIYIDEDFSPPHNNENGSPDFTALIQGAAQRAMKNILKKLFDDNLDPGFVR